MSRIERIKEEFLNLPEVKRLKELEGYIDSNPVIKNLFTELKAVQKKVIQYQESGEQNSYKLTLNDYNSLKNRLFDLPFVEEYLDLSENVDKKLENLCFEIEKELNNKINI